MLDELKNLNIDACSESELETLIRQILPIVITFIKASQKLLSEDKPGYKPCDNCDKYTTCKEPCDQLNDKLTGPLSGSHLLNGTLGSLMDVISDTCIEDTDDRNEILGTYDNNYLKAIDRVRSDDIFILYKNCIHLFSKTEWRVVTLKIDEGQTFKTIGLILGISRSTASDTFQRAKRKMERHYQKK